MGYFVLPYSLRDWQWSCKGVYDAHEYYTGCYLKEKEGSMNLLGSITIYKKHT